MGRRVLLSGWRGASWCSRMEVWQSPAGRPAFYGLPAKNGFYVFKGLFKKKNDVTECMWPRKPEIFTTNAVWLLS